MRAEANDSKDGQRAISSHDDRGEYVGWIIDDFPGTAEQVRRSKNSISTCLILLEPVRKKFLSVACLSNLVLSPVAMSMTRRMKLAELRVPIAGSTVWWAVERIKLEKYSINYHTTSLCFRPWHQAGMLEKHLSGYDENAHVPSRMDASSKLAPASASSGAMKDKVRAASLLSTYARVMST